MISTDKFIDEEYANVVMSWLKITKVEKIIEKERAEAVNEAERDKEIEIAKNLLDVLSEEIIAKKIVLSCKNGRAY